MKELAEGALCLMWGALNENVSQNKVEKKSLKGTPGSQFNQCSQKMTQKSQGALHSMNFYNNNNKTIYYNIFTM